MLIGLKQINQYLKNPVTIDQLVEIFSRTEIEVEEVRQPIRYDDKIITAQVMTVEKHPDADRLKIVTVQIGGDEQLEIVCGAPNVAKDQIVVLATVGAVLPDGTKITKSKIRGIISNGMLCSERELRISDDHEGILVLDPTTPVGKKLCDIDNNDIIVDIKTPPNRWDFLSLVGVALQVAAFDKRESLNEVKYPQISQKTYKSIKNKYVKNGEEASRFIAVKIGVDNAVKTPQWIVDNLQSSGLRSVSPVVDITNFVMLELGQPTHAYDAAKLHGEIRLRSALSSEKITTLDGKERKLGPEDLVIADDAQVVALAGVMGGIDTEVSEATKEIILEIATFNGPRVRKAALRHGLRSDASARFERSLPPHLAHDAAARLIGLLEECCEGVLLSPVYDDFVKPLELQPVKFSQRRAEKLIGIELNDKEFSAGLRRLGFDVSHYSLTKAIEQAKSQRNHESVYSFINDVFAPLGLSCDQESLKQWQRNSIDSDMARPGDVVQCGSSLQKPTMLGVVASKQKIIGADQSGAIHTLTLSEVVSRPDFGFIARPIPSFNHVFSVKPPWWRTDVRLEEDIVEEVTKLIGYDNIPMTLPDLPATNTLDHQLLPTIMRLKHQLVSRGLYEVISYAFVSRQALESVGVKANQHLEIHNPLTVEQQYLRSDLLASHLLSISANRLNKKKVTFFEASHVYIPLAGQPLPQERVVIGVAGTGDGSIGRVKAALEAVFGRAAITYRPCQTSAGISGRSFDVEVGGQVLGQLYQVKPAVLNKFGIKDEVSYGAVDVVQAMQCIGVLEAVDVPAYQLVTRDVNVEVATQVMWQDVEVAAKSIAHLTEIEYLSSFSDEALAKNSKKRFAIRLVFDLGPNPTQNQIADATKQAEHKLAKHFDSA